MIDNDRVLTVTPPALEAISAMYDQMRGVSQAWVNADPSRVEKAQASLTSCLARLFSTGAGNARIIRTDPISLEVSTESIYYGLVAFRAFRDVDAPHPDDQRVWTPVAFEGRFCFAVIEQARNVVAICGKPYEKGAPTCAGHDPFPRTVPNPIEWSIHS